MVAGLRFSAKNAPNRVLGRLDLILTSSFCQAVSEANQPRRATRFQSQVKLDGRRQKALAGSRSHALAKPGIA